MKTWELTASIDGVNIDYQELIHADTEPDFWTCYNIADAHGCPYFSVSEVLPE